MTRDQRPTPKVAVLGAGGRSGSAVTRFLTDHDDVDVVAELHRGDSLELLRHHEVEVVVDFTTPDSVMANTEFAITHGIHALVGTSGFDDARLTQIERWLAAAPTVGVLIAPNFSIGSVVATSLARRAARFFDSVEVVEAHHPGKLDAPSGTAMHTASEIARVRREYGHDAAPDATAADLSLPGARGATVDGVPVHALRLRGMIAQQQVILGGPGESLTIQHTTSDRSSFGTGVLEGIRHISNKPGLTIGLDSLLDL